VPGLFCSSSLGAVSATYSKRNPRLPQKSSRPDGTQTANPSRSAITVVCWPYLPQTHCSRFLILPHVPVPHLASHILGLILRLRSDRQRKYHLAPCLAETFIGFAHEEHGCHPNPMASPVSRSLAPNCAPTGPAASRRRGSPTPTGTPVIRSQSRSSKARVLRRENCRHGPVQYRNIVLEQDDRGDPAPDQRKSASARVLRCLAHDRTL
jgi:hypothetical protein